MAEDKGDALPLDEGHALSPSASVAKPVADTVLVEDDSDPDFDDLDGMCVYRVPRIGCADLYFAVQMSSINSPLLTIAVNRKPMSNPSNPHPRHLDLEDPPLKRRRRPPLLPWLLNPPNPKKTSWPV